MVTAKNLISNINRILSEDGLDKMVNNVASKSKSKITPEEREKLKKKFASKMKKKCKKG